MKRHLFTAVKILVSIGLIWWVFSRIEFNDTVLVQTDQAVVTYVIDHYGDNGGVFVRQDGAVVAMEAEEYRISPGFRSLMEQVRFGVLAIILPLMLIPPLFTWIRWWRIVNLQQIPLTLTEAVRLSYLGIFFNNFLPGSTGGDIPRAVILAKGAERKSAAVGTVLMDRVVGLSCMILTACIGIGIIAILKGELPDAFVKPAILSGTLIAGIVIGGGLYLSGRVRRLGLVRWVINRLPMKDKLAEVDSVFVSLRRHPRILGESILLSFAAQVSIALLVWGLVHAIGIGGVGLVDCLVMMPIILMLSAIPISFAGWGFGEMLFIGAFGLIGVVEQEALTLSLLFRMSIVLVSLPGGLFLIGGSSDAAPEETTA
jgi:uncharacterized membrane protein YbhN (UPF0104 family)